MAQENIEMVRAAFDAWNRGDHDSLIEMWDEEAEFYPLRAWRGAPIAGLTGCASSSTNWPTSGRRCNSR